MSLKAEQEHENRGSERNQRRAQHHARAQPRAQGAAALACIKLENVPEQQHQQREQQQEDEDGEAGEDQGFAGGFRIEEADAGGIERLQRAQQGKEQHHPACKQGNRPAPRIAEERHARL